MPHTLYLLAVSFFITGLAGAQTTSSELPRGDVLLSTDTRQDGQTWHVAAPSEKEAISAPGRAATANLFYAIWVQGGTQPWVIRFTRSTDGGLTWDTVRRRAA